MDVQFSCLQGFWFLFQGPTSNGIKANFIESCKPESKIDINEKSIYRCIVIASPKGVPARRSAYLCRSGLAQTSVAARRRGNPAKPLRGRSPWQSQEFLRFAQGKASSSCNFGTPRNDSSGTFALIIK